MLKDVLFVTSCCSVMVRYISRKNHLKYLFIYFSTRQDLKARLKEEISRVQSAIADQCSEDTKDRMRCELQVTTNNFGRDWSIFCCNTTFRSRFVVFAIKQKWRDISDSSYNTPHSTPYTLINLWMISLVSFYLCTCSGSSQDERKWDRVLTQGDQLSEEWAAVPQHGTVTVCWNGMFSQNWRTADDANSPELEWA